MKILFVSLMSALLLTCALSACSPATLIPSSTPIGSAQTLPLKVTLSLKTPITLENQGLRITLLEVRDSRCPANVDCVWAGEVGIDVEIAKIGVVYVRQPLYTLFNANAASEPKSVLAEGYTVKILEVAPLSVAGSPNGTQTVTLELTENKN